MKVLATILVIITSLVGFIFSYEFAYKKVVKIMQSPTEQVEPTGYTTR